MTRLSFWRHPLFIPFETPDKVTRKCHQMTVSSTARRTWWACAAWRPRYPTTTTSSRPKGAVGDLRPFCCTPLPLQLAFQHGWRESVSQNDRTLSDGQARGSPVAGYASVLGLERNQPVLTDRGNDRRRGFCHSADTPSPSLLKHLMKGYLCCSQHTPCSALAQATTRAKWPVRFWPDHCRSSTM